MSHENERWRESIDHALRSLREGTEHLRRTAPESLPDENAELSSEQRRPSAAP